MPVVTRADCSKLEWHGTFIFRHLAFLNYTNLVIVSGHATPDVVDCDVADGRTNDLGMYYQNLFLEGRVNETQKASFDKTVVGDGHCYTQIREVANIFLFDATNESDTALPTIEVSHLWRVILVFSFIRSLFAAHLHRLQQTSP